MAATHGPAHLDINNGIAHNDPLCDFYEDATCTAVAESGPLHGFEWCALCFQKPFKRFATDDVPV